METHQVVIVGAGIAGLAAARTLLDGGVKDIVILEAQDRAGGRISSVPLNGGWVETGAQWIHGQNNEVWKLAEKNNLLSSVTSAEGEGPYMRNDGVIFDPALVKEIHRVITEILEECEQFSENTCDESIIPASIGVHLREKFEQYLESCDDTDEKTIMKEELYDWHLRFQVIDNSCTALDKLSAKAWGTYTFSGGEDYVNFKEGYSSLVRCLANDLPVDVLYLNCPVTLVKWLQRVDQVQINHNANGILETLCDGSENTKLTNGYIQSSFNGIDRSKKLGSILNGNEKKWKSPPVTIKCGSGETFAAQHVIVTSSLGCLKENYKTMFEPPLPQSMAQAIEDMGFATINKIFLVFEKPWWSPETKGFQLIWSKDSNIVPPHELNSSWTRDLTGFDVAYGQEGILLGWVGGKGAELVEELTEKAIGLHCTELLRKFTKNENIPLPVRVIRSQWHKNPYIRGGYSNSTNLCDISNSGPSDLINPVWSDVYVEGVLTQNKHPTLLLAGEAAHEHYFSTTHGAYETGQRQAKVILEYLKSQ